MQGGWSLLSGASYEGRTDLVQLLLDHGANIDLPDDVSSRVLTAHVHSSYMSNRTHDHMTLLTLGAFAKGYSSCFVCLSVCVCVSVRTK